MKESKYRIIEDAFAGFEVQVKRKFLFFSWWSAPTINTYGSLEKAKEFIERLKKFGGDGLSVYEE